MNNHIRSLAGTYFDLLTRWGKEQKQVWNTNQFTSIDTNHYNMKWSIQSDWYDTIQFDTIQIDQYKTFISNEMKIKKKSEWYCIEWCQRG